MVSIELIWYFQSPVYETKNHKSLIWIWGMIKQQEVCICIIICSCYVTVGGLEHWHTGLQLTLLSYLHYPLCSRPTAVDAAACNSNWPEICISVDLSTVLHFTLLHNKLHAEHAAEVESFLQQTCSMCSAAVIITIQIKDCSSKFQSEMHLLGIDTDSVDNGDNLVFRISIFLDKYKCWLKTA